MNPCPCGYLSDPEKECKCSPVQVMNYRKKISGPIIDRIDLHVEVPRINFDKLEAEAKGESSEDVKKRVEMARSTQTKRFKGLPFFTNSEMNSENVKRFCKFDEISKNILKNAVEHMHLSARSYFRILKVARTIADLDGIPNVESKHIAEALQYRPKVM